MIPCKCHKTATDKNGVLVTGASGCRVCRGLGWKELCETCDGAGLLRGRVCVDCGGLGYMRAAENPGRLPADVWAEVRKVRT